jgi:hypothetical protein
MYHELIAELAGPGYDPRHIEAYMRIQYGTLDHLSRDDSKREVVICKQCIDVAGAVRQELRAVMNPGRLRSAFQRRPIQFRAPVREADPGKPRGFSRRGLSTTWGAS